MSRVVLGGRLVGQAPGDPCPSTCTLMLAAVTSRLKINRGLGGGAPPCPALLCPGPACSSLPLLWAFSFVAASFTHLVHLPVWEARFREEGTDNVLGCPCLESQILGPGSPKSHRPGVAVAGVWLLGGAQPGHEGVTLSPRFRPPLPTRELPRRIEAGRGGSGAPSDTVQITCCACTVSAGFWLLCLSSEGPFQLCFPGFYFFSNIFV